MKNLGRIILLILLIKLSLYSREVASVAASVDYPNVQKGEMVTYELMVNGDNIVRPTIQTLCGEDVISTGSQTSIQMINGIMTKSYILTYKFLPQKSCVIEPIEVEIDSKKLFTKSVKVNVSKQVTSKDDPFILTLDTNKKEVYVSEPFEVKLLFKQREDAEAIDSEFVAPSFNGFWIKNESDAIKYKENGYIVLEKKYLLAPQRVGKLNISSAEMRIAYRTHNKDAWAGLISRIKWKSNYSNELNIDVKPLPENLVLVGDFKISTQIDKDSIKSNEAVNLTIKVEGEGNLEDIKSFKPNMDNVNVFEEKINIEDNVLTQKMAFVSENDFTIPAFSLKYFNPKTKKILTIQTEPIDIKVKNQQQKKEELNIKRAEKTTQDSIEENSEIDFFFGLIIFVSGLVSGMLIIYFFRGFEKLKQSKKLDLNDEKLLFVKFLPYKENQDVKVILDALEANLYSKNKKVIDKKILKELVKRYNIS